MIRLKNLHRLSYLIFVLLPKRYFDRALLSQKNSTHLLKNYSGAMPSIQTSIQALALIWKVGPPKDKGILCPGTAPYCSFFFVRFCNYLCRYRSSVDLSMNKPHDLLQGGEAFWSVGAGSHLARSQSHTYLKSALSKFALVTRRPYCPGDQKSFVLPR